MAAEKCFIASSCADEKIMTIIEEKIKLFMTFPLAKLGFLLMKQLCKPLANFIIKEAKQHEFFRKYFCLPPARAYQWVEMTLKPRQFRGRPQNLTKLTDQEEVELGANLLGELILFSLLSAVLLIEINRQGDKKALKEKTQKDEITSIVEAISGLMHDVNELKKTVKQLKKKLNTNPDYLTDFQEMTSEGHEPEMHGFFDFWTYHWQKTKTLPYDDFPNSDPYSP